MGDPKKKIDREAQQKRINIYKTIKAIREIYGDDISYKAIGNILANVELETGWKDLRENAYSWDSIRNNKKNLVTGNKNLTSWGGNKETFNKLSQAEKLSVLYFGDTDHTDVAGGTGVLQLTSANYGGNDETESQIKKAAAELGIDFSKLGTDFYESALLTLQVMKNRGHDFEKPKNAKEARQYINSGETLTPTKEQILSKDYADVLTEIERNKEQIEKQIFAESEVGKSADKLLGIKSEEELKKGVEDKTVTPSKVAALSTLDTQIKTPSISEADATFTTKPNINIPTNISSTEKERLKKDLDQLTQSPVTRDQIPTVNRSEVSNAIKRSDIPVVKKMAAGGFKFSDIGVGLADTALSALGANTVMDKHYKGDKFKEAMDIVGQGASVAGKIGATALGGPLAGMAMGAVQQGVGAATANSSLDDIEESYDVQSQKAMRKMAMGGPKKKTGPRVTPKDNYLPLDGLRPYYLNEIGQKVSENKIGVGMGNSEYLLPTVINGQQLSEDAAIQHYKDTGEHMGKFDSIEEAERASKLRTNIYNTDPAYRKKLANGGKKSTIMNGLKELGNTKKYKGPSHEQGGINIGNNTEVEGGEVEWNNFIFTNRF